MAAAVDHSTVSSDDLGWFVAVGAGERRVDVGDDAVKAVHRDGIGSLLYRRGEPGTLLLRRHSHGDVADRRRDQRAFGTLDRAEHDLDRELAAVLAPPRSLDPGAHLTHARGFAVEVPILDVPAVQPSRDQELHRLPGELVAAVAELPLGLDVDQDDLAGGVDDHHRVRSGFQQPAVSALHLREMPLGRLALGDVAVDLEDRPDPAVRVSIDRLAALDGELPTVARGMDELALPVAGGLERGIDG